jgi:DNA mismatch endonuclease (patch repair protein)
MPATNTDFWQKKLKGNTVRDRKTLEELKGLGWRVLTVWECVTRDRTLLKMLGHMINEWIEGNEFMGSIPDSRITVGGVRSGIS